MEEKKKVKIVNIITTIRILGVFLIPLFSSLYGSLGAALYIGTLWTTDTIDGFLARKWEVSTIFGAALDTLADKVIEIASLIYLYVFYPTMLIPILLELATVVVNWKYGKRGANVKSSKLGKVKTVIFGFATGFTILSTISLTNILVPLLPLFIGITTLAEVSTLVDYIIRNEKYIKTHKTNNVSNLNFFETLKLIFKSLKNKNIYSPKYFKEHKNEPLLSLLLNKRELKKDDVIEVTQEDVFGNEKDYKFDVSQKNELKIVYSLNDNEIEKLENFAETHKLDSDLVMSYLSKYINTVNPTSYPTVNDMQNFIIEKEQEVIKKKSI